MRGHNERSTVLLVESASRPRTLPGCPISVLYSANHCDCRLLFPPLRSPPKRTPYWGESTGSRPRRRSSLSLHQSTETPLCMEVTQTSFAQIVCLTASLKNATDSSQTVGSRSATACEAALDAFLRGSKRFLSQRRSSRASICL